MNFLRYSTSLLFILFGLTLKLSAQFELPPLSAKGKIIQQVGYAEIEIEYERPSVRGRKIFGGLVPWNKVWRMGAGYCTKIRLSEEVQIGKQRIPKGYYSLHSIPTPEAWTIIINSDTTLYGSYGYDIKKDVARFQVPTEKSARFYETFTIDVDLVPNNAWIYVSWANTQIKFELKTRTDEKMQAYIRENLLTGKSKNADEYLTAADYYFYQGENSQDAILLLDKALKLDSTVFAYRLKMDFLEKLGRNKEALEMANKGLYLAKTRELADEKGRQEEIKFWEEAIQKIEVKINPGK